MGQQQKAEVATDDDGERFASLTKSLCISNMRSLQNVISNRFPHFPYSNYHLPEPLNWSLTSSLKISRDKQFVELSNLDI